jgi:hypothetical protein
LFISTFRKALGRYEKSALVSFFGPLSTETAFKPVLLRKPSLSLPVYLPP